MDIEERRQLRHKVLAFLEAHGIAYELYGINPVGIGVSQEVVSRAVNRRVFHRDAAVL